MNKRQKRVFNIRRGSLIASAVVAALAVSPTVTGSVTDLPVTSVNGKQYHYYDVQNRESIYTLSEKLGVTRDDILEYNPSAVDGLKPKMRLYFPVSAASDINSRAVVYAAAAGVKTHTVKKGETLYGIAKQYGMSPDRLAEMNPQVADGVRVGDTLTINADEEAERVAAQNVSATASTYANETGDTNGAATWNPTVPVGNINDVATVVTSPAVVASSTETDDVVSDDVVSVSDSSSAAHAEEADPLNVAVMLPFMLSEEQLSRTTQLYTEFFKGMLLAADSLKTAPGAPVTFTFYDTASSLDTLRSVMSRPEIETLDLIVAPDNSAHLQYIMDHVDDETLVLNIFAVKDENYKNYHNLIQTNIPHDAMYDRAIDLFLEKYRGVMPVFITRSSGMADKESFTTALKARLDADFITYREITFTSNLSDSDLSTLDVDVTPVVFVPNSGSKTEFARFEKAITRLRNNALLPSNVTIFGYPEWVTFRGDSFDEICELGASIYSRYLSNESNSATRQLKRKYKECYGVDMFEAVPTQGILGFDTGMYIIKGLKQLDVTGSFPCENDGIQSCIKLKRSGDAMTDDNNDSKPAGGLVNDALYLINYGHGGVVEWKN